jgi:hypothetical protein
MATAEGIAAAMAGATAEVMAGAAMAEVTAEVMAGATAAGTAAGIAAGTAAATAKEAVLSRYLDASSFLYAAARRR